MNRLKKIFISCLICLVAVETCGATRRRKNKNRYVIQTNGDNIKDKKYDSKHNDRTLFLFSIFSEYFNSNRNTDLKGLLFVFYSLLEENLEDSRIKGFHPIDSYDPLIKNDNHIESDLDRDLGEIRKRFNGHDFIWLDENNTKESINLTKLGYNERSSEILKEFDRSFNEVKDYIRDGVSITTEEDFLEKFDDYFRAKKIKVGGNFISMEDLMARDANFKRFLLDLKISLEKLYDENLNSKCCTPQEQKEAYELIKNFKLNFSKEIGKFKNLKVFKNDEDKEVFTKYMEEFINYFYNNARYKYHEKKVKIRCYNENLKDAIKDLEKFKGNKSNKINFFINNIRSKFNLKDLKNLLDDFDYCCENINFNNRSKEEDSRFKTLGDIQPSAIFNISTERDANFILCKVQEEYMKQINEYRKQHPKIDLVDSHIFRWRFRENVDKDSKELGKKTFVIQVGPIPKDKAELYRIKQNPITRKKREIYANILNSAVTKVIESLKKSSDLDKEYIAFLDKCALPSEINFEYVKKEYDKFLENVRSKNFYTLLKDSSNARNVHGGFCTSLYKMDFLNNFKNILIENLKSLFEEKLKIRYDNFVKQIKLGYDKDIYGEEGNGEYIDSIGDIEKIICDIKFKDNLKKEQVEGIKRLFRKVVQDLAQNTLKRTFEKTRKDFEEAKDEKSFETLKNNVLEFVALNYREDMSNSLKRVYNDIESSDEVPYQDEYAEYFDGKIVEVENKLLFEDIDEGVIIKAIREVTKSDEKESEWLNKIGVKEKNKYDKINNLLKEYFLYYCKNDQQKAYEMEKYFREELFKSGYLNNLTEEDIEDIIYNHMMLDTVDFTIDVKKFINRFLDVMKEYISNKSKSKNEINNNINSINENKIEEKKLDSINKNKDKIENKTLNIEPNKFLKSVDSKGNIKIDNYSNRNNLNNINSINENKSRIEEKSLNNFSEKEEKIYKKLESIFEKDFEKYYKSGSKGYNDIKEYFKERVNKKEYLEKLDEEDVEILKRTKEIFDNWFVLYFEDSDLKGKIDYFCNAIRDRISSKNESVQETYAKIMEYMEIISKYHGINIGNENKNKIEEKLNLINKDNGKINNSNNINSINENKGKIEEKSLDDLIDKEEKIYKKLESIFEKDFEEYYECELDSNKYRDMKKYFKDRVNKKEYLEKLDEEDIEKLKRTKESSKDFYYGLYDNDDLKGKIDYFCGIIEDTIIDKEGNVQEIYEKIMKSMGTISEYHGINEDRNKIEEKKLNLFNENKGNINNNININSINEDRNKIEEKKLNLFNKNKSNINSNNINLNSINENKGKIEKEKLNLINENKSNINNNNNINLNSINENKNKIEEKKLNLFNKNKSNINNNNINLNSINEDRNKIEEEKSLNNLSEEQEEIYKELESMFKEEFKKYSKGHSKIYNAIKKYFRDKVSKKRYLEKINKTNVEVLKKIKKDFDMFYGIYYADDIKRRINNFCMMIDHFILDETRSLGEIYEKIMESLGMISIYHKSNTTKENEIKKEKSSLIKENKSKKNKINGNSNKFNKDIKEKKDKYPLLLSLPKTKKGHHKKNINKNLFNMVERKNNININIKKVKLNDSDKINGSQKKEKFRDSDK